MELLKMPCGFPRQVQTCIVHLPRHSMSFSRYKNRKGRRQAVCHAVRFAFIHQAMTPQITAVSGAVSTI